ncbi:sugar diacid recognition domain-containing protein, partial [Klebsiella pneumoniae]|uniref:sugar diacid recognition domain-containing protein n=1 Tax=Klebsiella pneumoniae TaxID=573 RepID=UPI003967EBA8
WGVADRRVVEIDEQAAACLRGVRPGVNLPLLHAERLVGVLGITGAPEVVPPCDGVDCFDASRKPE